MAATATATASSGGIRYAPEDPTLPKPWKGLVDGKTGYLYYWNPVTNSTQYERPTASLSANSTSSHKPLSSSVDKSPVRRHNSDNDEKYTGGPAKDLSGGGDYHYQVLLAEFIIILYFLFGSAAGTN